MLRAVLLLLLFVGGCMTREFTLDGPHVDTTPLGCGYKWFQAGYSPTQEFTCELSRESIKKHEMALATKNAWEVARTRCPKSCKPTELKDSVISEERFPEGICRNGTLYFSTRVYFLCGGL